MRSRSTGDSAFFLGGSHRPVLFGKFGDYDTTSRLEGNLVFQVVPGRDESGGDVEASGKRIQGVALLHGVVFGEASFFCRGVCGMSFMAEVDRLSDRHNQSSSGNAGFF